MSKVPKPAYFIEPVYAKEKCTQPPICQWPETAASEKTMDERFILEECARHRPASRFA